MNVALGNGAISEMECGNNFAYVLNENSQFLLTEYKVLQAQGNRGFVKCMKMMHNGKTELYYMASGYKNLASLITLLDADGFMMIAANFIQNIIEVKNNGFLSCQNIALSFDKIFIDMSDYRTYLTYLPANTGQTEDYAAFEAELRTSLIKIIKNSTNLESEKTAQFAVDLSDGTLTLQDLYNHICGTKILPEKTKEKEKDASDQEKRKNLKLVSLNMTKQVESSCY